MADFDALMADDDIMGTAESPDLDDMTEHDRAKLLRRISKITGKSAIGGKREVRKEASKNAAEFGAIKRKTGVAPTLNRLLTSVKESGEGKAADKINKLVKAPTGKPVTTLDAPLEKPQALKTKREILYENTKQDVSRWNAIVYHNRVADQLVFPLNSGKKVARKTGKDAAEAFMPMTPLEEEMAKVLYGEEYLIQKKAAMEKPTGPTDAEAYMLSVEEALANHSEMARLRALQSYQITKAKRQNKIKSKKYHRLLRKEKIKKQLKEFENLQKTDPEAALVKLEELEKSRIQERMSLKHRNTSKWAKMQSARAKYDKDSRIALSEQLKISHQLTQKVQEVSSEDEDLDLDIPQLVKSSVDNPWMLQSEVKDSDKLQLYYTGYKKLWEDINAKKQKDLKKQAEQMKTENDVSNEIPPEEQTVARLEDITETKEGETLDCSVNADSMESKSDTQPKPKELPVKHQNKKKPKPPKQPKKQKKSEVSAEDDTFENFDVDALVDKAEEKLRLKAHKQLKLIKKEEIRQQKQALRAKKNLRKNKKTKKQKEGDADEIREMEINTDQQIVESAPGEEEDTENANTSTHTSLVVQANSAEPSKKAPVLLNPKNFLKISKSKNEKKFDGSQVVIDWGDDDEVAAEEEDAEESQRKLIAEAFEDDDVVDEFKKRKDSEIEASKPKDIDLHLPGWGDWGGQGVKPNPRKRQRYIIKAPKQRPRKDAKLSHVILNQEAGEKIRDHQVRELPFPFKRVKDFERTVRAPIGRTWMTEESVKSLTSPKVITRLGSVIEPLSEDVLVQTKHGQAKDLNVPVSIKRLAKVKK